jgi:hypothetical protein
MRAMAPRMACRARSSRSWETVVRSTYAMREARLLSQPTTERSSGTEYPIFRASVIAPMAEASL